MEKKHLANIGNFIFTLFAVLLLGNNFSLKKPEDHSYLKYVKEITYVFSKEMKKKYDLQYIGGGGSMPRNVQSIAVNFVSSRGKVSVKEAREIGVDSVQILLKEINSNEKIRKYLCEYPFGPNRVDISISFEGKCLDDRMNGHVASLYLASDKVFYDTIELVKKTLGGGCDARDPKNIIYHPTREEIVEEYVPILVESFDEAKKLASGCE